MNDALDRDELEAWDVEPLGAGFEDRLLEAWDEEQEKVEPPRRVVWLTLLSLAAAAALAVATWPRPDPAEVVSLHPGASARVEYTAGTMRADQTEGTVTYEVPSGMHFVVHTPAADITVHGTVFTVEMLEMNDPTRRKYLGAGTLALTGAAVAVYVSAGTVEVRNGHGAVEVSAGQTAVASEAAAPRSELAEGNANAEATPKSRRELKHGKRITAAQRDDARRRIEAALAETPHVAQPAPREDDVSEEPSGSLDKDYIRAVVTEDLVPLAKECYEAALAEAPDLGGSLILQFSIAGDESVGGIVDEVEVADGNVFTDPSTAADPPPPGTKIDRTPDGATMVPHFPLDASPEFVECLEASTASLLLDPPEGGGRVVVQYPFVFEPSEEP